RACAASHVPYEAAWRFAPHAAAPRGRARRAKLADREASRACSSHETRGMEDDVRAPEIGDVIGGKYRLEAVVGRGGMSVVYKATHLDLERHVALKVLSPDAARNPEYVARLKHEARAVARIKSEHVGRVFDVGEIDDT